MREKYLRNIKCVWGFFWNFLFFIFFLINRFNPDISLIPDGSYSNIVVWLDNDNYNIYVNKIDDNGNINNSIGISVYNSSNWLRILLRFYNWIGCDMQKLLHYQILIYISHEVKIVMYKLENEIQVLVRQ